MIRLLSGIFFFLLSALYLLDAAGNVYVADTLSDPYSARVRKVDASTGILTTFAGNGKQQSPVDNVPATQSAVVYPFGVGFDTSGNLLIAETDAETDNHRVRKVNGQSGIITTIAGTGPAGFGVTSGLRLTPSWTIQSRYRRTDSATFSSPTTATIGFAG